MPQKHKNRKTSAKPQKPPRPKAKGRRKNANSGIRPTLVLKARVLINQNISATNVKQINIAPSLSFFNNDII
jgi:hypothetical protein